MSHVEIVDASPVVQPKKEMVWPQLRRIGCSGSEWIYFTDHIGLGVRAGRPHIDSSWVHAGCYTKPPADTQWQIKITAGDGSEFPRVVKASGDSSHWLCLKAGAGHCVSLDDPFNVTPSRLGVLIGQIHKTWDGSSCGEPLPKGTITTITVSEGKLSAEFEEPKPAFPHRLEGGARIHHEHGHTFTLRTADNRPALINESSLQAALAYIKEHAND